MIPLNPKQIYELSRIAYDSKSLSLQNFKAEVRGYLPEVNRDTIKVLTGTSGLISSTNSNFGFMAVLNGGRSREVVIATRGTASLADAGTDVNAWPLLGPTGHLVHGGFCKTFKSYVQQLNEFIKNQNLGFCPTAVHCMGHSLGGALANLNAAACAELGLNSYLYSVAAPRVGMIPYAEHLSRKMKAAHVYRVANEADVVTMVPSFPYMHSPFVHGTYLLDGGMRKISVLEHMMENGYTAMKKSTWRQMESLSQGMQRQLENSMYPGNKKDASYLEKLLSMPGAMFSGRMLNMINLAINDILRQLGAFTLITVNHFGTGAFTVLDQLSEMLARFATASLRKAHEMQVVLNAVMAYLGRETYKVADSSVATIRWVFSLLSQSMTTMATQALQLAAR